MFVSGLIVFIGGLCVGGIMGIFAGMLLAAWCAIRRQVSREAKETQKPEYIICYQVHYKSEHGNATIKFPCNAQGKVDIDRLSSREEELYAEILARNTVEGTPVIYRGISSVMEAKSK